ncbi:MAG: 16S rRNA (cytosine(1402)-N(4))-methyltransferase RsmH [Candidatus Limnocylindrus sp.]|jgi:16S rRNA (cytosine1402-N4)-methyltransferase
MHEARGAAQAVSVHEPVLLRETIEALAPRSGGAYIDANLGGGGHAAAVLAASAPNGTLLGIDADASAIARSTARLSGFGARLKTFHGSSARIAEAAAAAGFHGVDGILFDLGLSSDQLVDRDRGFGIRTGGRLDLRFNPTEGESAAALLAHITVPGLTKLLREFGEEPQAGKIARAIVARRAAMPVTTAEELAALVAEVATRPGKPSRIHPATRVFQALRIAVNDELGALAIALDASIRLLAVGGRIVVLTYHSLEDRIVKNAFAAAAKGCICPPKVPRCGCGVRPSLRLITDKPLTATEEEVAKNPRSRSAKMRVAERIEVAA